MPYSFDYDKFAQRIEDELRNGDVNGEDIARAIKRQYPETRFTSARVHDARIKKTEKISDKRIQEWVAYFQSQHPTEGWSVDKFVEEFGVEDYAFSSRRLKMLEDTVSVLTRKMAWVESTLLADSLRKKKEGREKPHPFAAALREKLKEIANVDCETAEGQQRVIEAAERLGAVDRQEVRRILLTNDAAPPDIKKPWNDVLLGMAEVFTDLTGRSYTPQAIADIMERRGPVVVSDPLATLPQLHHGS